MYPLYSSAPEHPAPPEVGTVVKARVIASLESIAQILPEVDENQNEYPLEATTFSFTNSSILLSPVEALTEAETLAEGLPEAEEDGEADADGLFDCEALGLADCEADGLAEAEGEAEEEGETKLDNLARACWACKIPGVLLKSIPTHS